MEHSLAFYELKRLHAELAGRLQVNAAERRRLALDIRHVEAVMKMLEPSFNIRLIAPRRRNKPSALFARGTIYRRVIDVLREAPEPMTGRDICRVLYRQAGVPDPTIAQVQHLFGAVNRSLRRYTGRMVRQVNDGSPARWVLMEESAAE